MRNLPPIYDEVKEMEELSSSIAVELDDLDKAREQVEDEQFIMTSSEKFIRIRERGYDIRADPTNESLDFRRHRIITRQSTRLPITQRKVHEILSILVGHSNFEEHLNVADCETTFIFDATDGAMNREIDFTLDRIIPLNMDLKIARRTQSNFYVPSYLSSGTEITLYPMNIEEVKQDAGVRGLVGIKTAKSITLNPLQQ